VTRYDAPFSEAVALLSLLLIAGSEETHHCDRGQRQEERVLDKVLALIFANVWHGAWSVTATTGGGWHGVADDNELLYTCQLAEMMLGKVVAEIERRRAELRRNIGSIRCAQMQLLDKARAAAQDTSRTG